MWVKPLTHGASAVALLNRGATPMWITTTARAIGMTHVSRYRLANLWTRRTHNTTGEISELVPPDAALLYRVTPNPIALAAGA